MADDKQTPDTPAAGGGKKKIILLVIIALVLVAISVGGTLMALGIFGAEEEVAGEVVAAEETTEPAVAEKLPAIYYPLKPTIIVNFNARGKQRFLQAEVSLMVRENDVVAAIEEHSVMLQHSLLMLFGAQDYDEMQTAEGKELLRQQALEVVRGKLEQEIGKPGVEQVLFTSFVMQ